MRPSTAEDVESVRTNKYFQAVDKMVEKLEAQDLLNIPSKDLRQLQQTVDKGFEPYRTGSKVTVSVANVEQLFQPVSVVEEIKTKPLYSIQREEPNDFTKYFTAKSELGSYQANDFIGRNEPFIKDLRTMQGTVNEGLDVHTTLGDVKIIPGEKLGTVIRESTIYRIPNITEAKESMLMLESGISANPDYKVASKQEVISIEDNIKRDAIPLGKIKSTSFSEGVKQIVVYDGNEWTRWNPVYEDGKIKSLINVDTGEGTNYQNWVVKGLKATIIPSPWTNE